MRTQISHRLGGQGVDLGVRHLVEGLGELEHAQQQQLLVGHPQETSGPNPASDDVLAFVTAYQFS